MCGSISWAANGFCDATGPRRRLRALMSIGWPAGFLAHEMSVAPATVRKIMTGDAERVTQLTFKRVVAVYDRYSMRPAPSDSRFEQARLLARDNGWVSPLAWDDDVIDDVDAKPNLTGGRRRPQGVDEIAVWRFLNGDYDVVLNQHERRAVCQGWVARGGSHEELARVTGWNVWRMVRREAAA